MRVLCPTCRRELVWSESPFRPFCSERCRLIDLGAWLSERHAIPCESPEPSATHEVGDDTDSSTDPAKA
ncbi:MAG: DNA gyrase inhibitor YacG [Steroidobacterales bacterium]